MTKGTQTAHSGEPALFRRSRLSRAITVSVGIHVLLFIAATVLARPRFHIPRPVDAIPVDLVTLPAPAPAIAQREETPAVQPPEVVPDPMKPAPRPPVRRREEPRRAEPERPRETPKPKEPEKPKVGSVDTTQVVRSELPAVGDVRGALQLRAEGEILPYAYYLQIVQRKIASFWEPPQGIQVPGGEVAATVWFRIERDGRVRTRYVEQESGSSFFDNSTLRALEMALPFPPLPEEYSGDHLIIHLRFVYSE